MVNQNFKQLAIWQKGMEICRLTYVLTREFPREEMFGLVSQMRRAAVSVPSNIAEGFNRFSKADFQRFLGIALGSCGELETQLGISKQLNFLKNENTTSLEKMILEEQRMIKGFINSLRTSDPLLRTSHSGLRTSDSALRTS